MIRKVIGIGMIVAALLATLAPHMLNPIMAGPGVATRATARTICEDGAEDTASNLHSYQEAAPVGGLFQFESGPF